jgi:aminopeptidase N
MTSRALSNGRFAAAFLLPLLAAPLLLSGQPADLMQRPEHFERSRDYDALHYRLVFDFDDKDRSYRGENTITLASLRDGLERLVFDAEDLEVTGVTGPGGRPLPCSLGNGKLAVLLPKALAYGEKTSVVVSFSQKDPRTGLKFIQAAPDHPAQINTYSWPEDARHWFPCYDDPSDKATSEVIATVRGDWKVLSNGRLEGVRENQAGGTRTWHWSQDKPHPAYGIMLAAGPFEVLKDSLRGLPVDYWVYPKDVADAPRSFRKTPKMIDFYGRTFGFPYPWAKYDQVCVAGYGGGMEATTATILGQGTIHDERADQDFSSEGLVAHELAHMWWGDLVTERAWPDVWLSESFATYSEYLFTRSENGDDEGALDLEAKKDDYLEEARTRYIRPIVFNRYDEPWQIMDGHSYPKGAAVLHMLRFVMGDRAFFRALREFLERFAFKNADTHDFMTVVKDTSGQNLDWFFDEWVYRPGHPLFEVGSTWDAGAAKLRLVVRQKQDLGKGIPVYRTPVAIGVRTARDVSHHRVWLSRAEETFDLDVSGKPLLVRFDEGNFLLKELVCPKSAEELVFGLRNDDVVGRVWAAGQLSPLASPEVRKALEGAARTDTSWAVRKAAVEALVGARTGPGLRELVPALEGLLSDRSSKVRAAAVRGLARSKDPALVPVFEDVFRKDSSYTVQAAALSALGDCGGPDEVPFLKKAAAMASPRDTLRRSAETAIKKVGAPAPGRPNAIKVN